MPRRVLLCIETRTHYSWHTGVGKKSAIFTCPTSLITLYYFSLPKTIKQFPPMTDFRLSDTEIVTIKAAHNMQRDRRSQTACHRPPRQRLWKFFKKEILYSTYLRKTRRVCVGVYLMVSFQNRLTMRRHYLEGLPRLRSLICFLLCPGSCFAGEVTRYTNLPRRYGDRSNDHGLLF